MAVKKKTTKTEESTQTSEDPRKEQGRTEETFHVKGEQLLGKVKELIKEGNVRRIIIKDKTGKTLVEFPLTVGVIGAFFAPALAAVGAIAALVTECSITVERES